MIKLVKNQEFRRKNPLKVGIFYLKSSKIWNFQAKIHKDVK